MPRVLLLDDDERLRLVISAALERAGYTVMAAASAKEAVELLESFAPDLLISDIVMPDKEGLETIREVQKCYPRLPILAISGSDFSALYLHAAAHMGAAGSLQKPFDTQQLLAAVSGLLARTPEKRRLNEVQTAAPDSVKHSQTSANAGAEEAGPSQPDQAREDSPSAGRTHLGESGFLTPGEGF